MKSFKDGFAYELKESVQTVPNLMKVMQKNLVKNPDASVETASDNFTTVNGGLLEECIIDLVPVQSGSGNPSPDNVRPISGHTQVEVDVSDGQTTQEQVTVNLGGTYYGGTLDVVSGVFIADMAGVDVSASDLINQYLDTSNNQYLAGINANAKIPATVLTLGNVKCNELTSKAQNNLFNEVGDAICIMDNGNLRITFSGVTTFADMQTWVTNHPLQVVYELATPETIQLTPQQIEALTGKNNLSCPLEGQSIKEVNYREIFTFSDVKAYSDAKAAAVLPEDPAEDGTYTLKLTKSGSTITKAWTADTP